MSHRFQLFLDGSFIFEDFSAFDVSRGVITRIANPVGSRRCPTLFAGYLEQAFGTAAPDGEPPGRLKHRRPRMPPIGRCVTRRLRKTRRVENRATAARPIPHAKVRISARVKIFGFGGEIMRRSTLLLFATSTLLTLCVRKSNSSKTVDDSTDWNMHGRSYDEQRFSPLSQINEQNVEKLGLVWSHEFGTTRAWKPPRSS